MHKIEIGKVGNFSAWNENFRAEISDFFLFLSLRTLIPGNISGKYGPNSGDLALPVIFEPSLLWNRCNNLRKQSKDKLDCREQKTHEGKTINSVGW